MWFLAVYVKWNQNRLSALQPVKNQVAEAMTISHGAWWGATMQATFEDEKPTISITPLKMHFALFYFIDYWPYVWLSKLEKSKNKGIVAPEKTPNYPKHLIFSNQVFTHCLDPKNGFLEKSRKDDSRVFITLQGEQFAGIIGLFREWVMYLGPFWSVGGIGVLTGLLHFFTTGRWW